MNYTNKTLQEAAEGIIVDSQTVYRTYNIGFNDGDETQFDALAFSDLEECWNDFCDEHNANKNSVDYVECVGITNAID